MAIRKRNKSVSDVKEVDDSNSESSTSKHSLENGEEILKTFREEAIKTLNILEASGINIYDETRTPGMYVKQRLKKYYGKDDKSTPKTLINILSGNNVNKNELVNNDENVSEDLRLKLMKALRK